MNDGSEGGEKELAASRVTGVKAGQWHTLTVRFAGNRITALVDGKQQLAATDDLYGAGMAGILAGAGTGADKDKLSMAWFDNLVIKPAGDKMPAPAKANAGQLPLYPVQNNQNPLPSGKR